MIMCYVLHKQVNGAGINEDSHDIRMHGTTTNKIIFTMVTLQLKSRIMLIWLFNPISRGPFKLFDYFTIYFRLGGWNWKILINRFNYNHIKLESILGFWIEKLSFFSKLFAIDLERQEIKTLPCSIIENAFEAEGLLLQVSRKIHINLKMCCIQCPFGEWIMKFSNMHFWVHV